MLVRPVTESRKLSFKHTYLKPGVTMYFYLFTVAIILTSSSLCNGETTIAKAFLFRANSFDYIGTITFSQEANSDIVKVSGKMTGLDPKGKHGFHIHEKGDLGNGCKDAGGHFNPENNHHAGPTDSVRHVGDLGNVDSPGGASGVTTVSMEDKVIELNGLHSIIGRAVVVHHDVDDLGKGNWSDSRTTGHAGIRLACGVVAIASDGYKPSHAHKSPTAATFVVFASLIASTVSRVAV